MINVETIVRPRARTLPRDHGQHHGRRVDEGDCPAPGRHGARSDEDFSKHGSDVLGAATVEEKAAKQIDFVKKSYEAAIANTELTELYSKGHTEAFAALSHRVSELTEEVKAAIAKKVIRCVRADRKGPLRGPFFCYGAGTMDQITYDDFTKSISASARSSKRRRSRRTQARASIVDRLRARAGIRKSSAQLTVHYTRKACRPPGGGGGQLSPARSASSCRKC